MWQRWNAAGRLTEDAELRYTQAGPADPAGDRQEKFKKFIGYLVKGKPIIVVGRFQNRSWDKEDGTKGYATEVVLLEPPRFLPDGKRHEQGDQPPAPEDDDVPF